MHAKIVTGLINARLERKSLPFRAVFQEADDETVDDAIAFTRGAGRETDLSLQMGGSYAILNQYEYRDGELYGVTALTQWECLSPPRLADEVVTHLATLTHHCSHCQWVGREDTAAKSLQWVYPADAEDENDAEQVEGIMCPVCTAPVDKI